MKKGERGQAYQGLVRMAERSMQTCKDEDSEGWRLLANAVIVQAVRDYQEGRISYMDLYRFLKSDWFTLLSRGCVSPDSILKEVTMNGKKENKGYRTGPKTFL